MGELSFSSNPAIVEPDPRELKKRRFAEQGSAALTLLLLRDGTPIDSSVNHANSCEAKLSVGEHLRDQDVHAPVTDDEGELKSHFSVASKRHRPVVCKSPANLAMRTQFHIPGKLSTLLQPSCYLPEGRPLPAPPKLQMPRGFLLRKPPSK